MFIHYRTQGFILDKEDRGEADRLFSIFTKDFGRLNILAKGERKIASKLRSGLRLFSLSEIEFIQGKSYKTLTDAISLRIFKNISRNLGSLKVARMISDATARMTSMEQPDLIIWNLLIETFSRLNQLSNSLQLSILYNYFIWNLLAVSGYRPELFKCLLCSKKIRPDKIYFSAIEGGTVCPACKAKSPHPIEVSQDAVKIIRFFLSNSLDTALKLRAGRGLFKELSLLSGRYLDSINLDGMNYDA